MYKFIIQLIVFCGGLLLFGCGHSTLTVTRGTGFQLTIPLFGTGTNLVALSIGNIDTTTSILRGGATAAVDTAKGGAIGSLASGDHIVLITAPGVTEGYAKEVLTSPYVDVITKQMLINYLTKFKTALPPPSAVTSINAGVSNGKDAPNNPKAVSAGIEKALDTTEKVVPGIIKPVTDTVKHVSTSVEKVSTSAVKAVPSMLNDLKWLIISVVIILLTIGVLYYHNCKYSQFVKSSKNDTVNHE